MVWKESYRIGVPEIDEQHMELFERVESFLKIIRSSEPWDSKTDKVNETLQFMKNYVITHFRDEEKLQKKIGYPDIEAHIRLHKSMIDYVAEIEKRCQTEGISEILMQQFGGKLLAWLINHVAAADQKIANYEKSINK